MKKLYFLTLFMLFAFSLFGVKMSPDKTQFSYMFDGNERIGSTPLSLIDDVVGLEIFINTLKLLEKENEEKQHYLKQYNATIQVDEEFVDKVDDAVVDTAEAVDIIIEKVADIDTTPIYTRLVLGGGIGISVDSSINNYYYGSLIPMYYIIGDKSSIILGCDIRYTTIGLISFGGLISIIL